MLIFVRYNLTNATVDTNNLSTILPFWEAMRSVLNENMSRLLELHNFENIKSVIDIWSNKTYCPILHVSRNRKLRQVYFTYITWQVKNLLHVTYTTKSNMNFEMDNEHQFWLSSSRVTQFILNVDENDWIIVNLQQIGKY